MSDDGRVERVAGAALVLGGVATAIEASTFDVAFLTDPVGPKALPALVATILVMSGLRLVLRPRAAIALPNRGVTMRMAGATFAFLIYAGILPWLGFFTSTSMVVTALALLYSGPGRGSIAAGLAVSGVLWLLFVALLGLPLPVGDLWIR